jgi:hypothetical protein
MGQISFCVYCSYTAEFKFCKSFLKKSSTARFQTVEARAIALGNMPPPPFPFGIGHSTHRHQAVFRLGNIKVGKVGVSPTTLPLTGCFLI